MKITHYLLLMLPSLKTTEYYICMNQSGTVLFYKNRAETGGVALICATHFQSTLTNPKYLNFIGNTASFYGGAVYYFDCDEGEGRILLSGYFVNNMAGECGGAMYMAKAGEPTSGLIMDILKAIKEVLYALSMPM